MKLEKYSMGIGDRFARQGKAQLRALARARESGVDVAPVWNKSHREHTIIGTQPGDTRVAADAAVQALDWQGSYYVDADHISLANVDLFVDASDFFTLDVADFIGEPADDDAVQAFVERHRKYAGRLEIPGAGELGDISPDTVADIARKFLLGVQEAGRIYRRLVETKGEGSFVTEVSMDETDEPQSPIEMFFILAALADEKIPAQTIAPKFTGRFNKGVDYVGDVDRFSREFADDLAVIACAVREFGLPANLKLSVHSGSDKFAIYGPMRRLLREHDAGVHLKTAGTTWLEELIGLAEAGGGALDIARDVYRAAWGRFDELCGPYATVIDIDRNALPSPDDVATWSGPAFAAALRHEQDCPDYNPSFRQLLHVGYKVAAEMGGRYLDALDACADTIGHHVAQNIFERHLRRVFPGL